jgi:glycine/D-amino acid oxidase-like deaminating enzyme
VVLGAGLLGLASAYWLARAGYRPLILERGIPAAGATGRNGGLLVAGTAEAYPAAIARHGHETARAVWQLTLGNRALVRQVLADEAIGCDYREPGHLALALGAAQHDAMARTVAALAADGFRAELLGRAQAQELVGTPLGDEVVGALFTPEDGVLHSARLLDGLAGAALRHGAQLHTGTGVLSIHAEAGGLRLETTRGPVVAARVLLAANAWLGELVPGWADLVRPVRGQALAYAPSAEVFRAGMGAALTPTGEYWQQTPDGAIILGGCRAAAPGHDEGVRVQAPSAVVQSAIEGVLPRMFPQLASLQVAQRWAGLMAFTRDYLPIADEVPGLPGAWAVGGFCGHGMPFGLRLGQLLAAALTGAHPAELLPLRSGRPTLARSPV